MTSSKLIDFSRITSRLYSKHRIAKRSGGYRVIHVPSNALKVLQMQILRGYLDNVPTAEYLFAFEKGRSVIDKAARHVGRKFVVSFDIKDFFPSITTKHVVDALSNAGLEGPAPLLAELCCYKYYLPQGAVTSPKLSNLVVQSTFGPDLHEYCIARGITMTVYADDITLSFDDGDIDAIIAFTKACVARHGFSIHEKGKLKVMRSSQRQEVCGIVVNTQLGVARSDRRIIRAQAHRLATNRPAFEDGKTLTQSQVAGRIGWVGQVNPSHAQKLNEVLNAATH